MRINTEKCIDGVKIFIQFAFPIQRRELCTCRNSHNCSWLEASDVQEHLGCVREGFTPLHFPPYLNSTLPTRSAATLFFR
jgi:hypothetical protein